MRSEIEILVEIETYIYDYIAFILVRSKKARAFFGVPNCIYRGGRTVGSLSQAHTVPRARTCGRGFTQPYLGGIGSRLQTIGERRYSCSYTVRKQFYHTPIAH